MNVVVYYRTRPCDLFYSNQALKEQREAVSAWLTDNPASVLAEYTEPETDGASRPRLAEAAAASKQANATLLIARTEAIGSGIPFSPRIGSVTVAIAPKAIREIGHIIPAPLAAKAGLSLYFPDHRAMGSMPIYLCNGTSEAIHDAAVSVASITSKMLDDDAMPPSLSLTPAQFRAPILPPRTAILIDYYDPMSDGDFITVFEVTSREQQQRALAGPGGLSAPFIAINPS